MVKKKKSGTGAAILIIILIAAMFFVGYTYFRVARIEVEGNENVEASYIAELSGVELDENLFAIDKNKVKQYINSDPYLEYFDLKRIYPSAVRIEVYERIPAAAIEGKQGFYVVDKEGYVLERLSDSPSDMVLVEGMALLTAYEGRKIEPENAYDFNALVTLLKDVKYNELAEMVTEMNFSDINNITMRAGNGFTIEFGQPEMISEKVTWILAVAERLEQENIYSGVINVVAGSTATYREIED